MKLTSAPGAMTLKARTRSVNWERMEVGASVSAIVHFKVHEPPGTLRVALPEFEAALLAEVAEDEEVPVERLAADLLVEMLRSRAW